MNGCVRVFLVCCCWGFFFVVFANLMKTESERGIRFWFMVVWMLWISELVFGLKNLKAIFYSTANHALYGLGEDAIFDVCSNQLYRGIEERAHTSIEFPGFRFGWLCVFFGERDVN